jgi:hypothetical protein
MKRMSVNTAVDFFNRYDLELFIKISLPDDKRLKPHIRPALTLADAKTPGPYIPSRTLEFQLCISSQEIWKLWS